MTTTLSLALDALYQIILPIFIVLGVGFVAGRRLLSNPSDDPSDGLRPISKVVFYILAPCLVFSSMATSDVALGQMGRIGLFALAMTLLTGLIGWGLARSLRLPPRQASSLLLVAMFANIGNYGLPFNELAYGPSALDRAVIYFVTSAVLLFSLGVLIAAHGQGSSLTHALRRASRIPVVYALAIALFVRLGVFAMPAPILKATSLLGQASVPLMLLILGMQLSNVQVRGNWRLLTLASGTRLLLAPLLAIPLSSLFGLTGLARQVSVAQASMPSAVFNTLLALEFNLALDLTTGTVLLTTLFSPVTLILLVTWLR